MYVSEDCPYCCIHRHFQLMTEPVCMILPFPTKLNISILNIKSKIIQSLFSLLIVQMLIYNIRLLCCCMYNSYLYHQSQQEEKFAWSDGANKVYLSQTSLLTTFIFYRQCKIDNPNLDLEPNWKERGESER